MRIREDAGRSKPTTRDESEILSDEEEELGQASEQGLTRVRMQKYHCGSKQAYFVRYAPNDGGVQAKEHPRGHVGHTDEELREMRKYDLKRVKRIMANRSRCAVQGQKTEIHECALSNEQRNVQEEFYAMQASIATVSKENDLLSQEIGKLNEDLSRANLQSRQLKQHAHLLRMQVLSVPVLNMTSLPNYAAAQNDGLPPSSLQLPRRASVSAIPEPLASFTNNPRPSPFGLGSQPDRENIHLHSMMGAPPPNPFAASQLWPNRFSTSSTSSAMSSHTPGQMGGIGAEGQFAADSPYLLNMLQSMDLSDGAALPSDVSSQSAMYNTGSSWTSVRPNLPHLASESRSSLGSLTPADTTALNLLLNSHLPATGGTDPSSLLPLLREQSREQIQRRSAGDYPMGLQAPLQGLARFSRHFSTPNGPEASLDRRGGSLGGPPDRSIRRPDR